MLPTGDVQGGLRKLESLIRTIKYTGPVNYSSLTGGDPAAFLPIVSHTLTSFSPVVTEQLVALGFELTGKTDLRFIETVYKVLRDVFQYKPVLTKEQFLQWGFCQRKISVVCDIISLVLKRHNQHKKNKPKSRFPASHKNVKVETISFADLENAVPAKPYVVNHVENPPTIPVTVSHKEPSSSKIVTHSAPVERFSSQSPEHGGLAEEETADKPYYVELQERFSTLETRVEKLVSGLDRLSVLEKRFEKLETLNNKDKTEEQLITISRETWENLLSRVLLLETKLELSSAKENVPPLYPDATTSFVPKVLFDVPQPSVKCVTSTENDLKELDQLTLSEPDNQDDLKERLERITKMLKSTSSLLKSSDNYS
ncbi:centrosomal protein of 44 kDa [Periophthalmus magnuspinnatus]|uniref:centrosomal protein of 44 kDa n=1 Tax=Periophthalmus magnuspinnatus TaxID=409849 RepID=UPI00145BFB09|nr:centrosomal protein of 44 kDa [Periophthalmus magnuspinnatus]